MEYTKPIFLARLLIQAERPDIAHGVLTNASTVVPSWHITAADVRGKMSSSQLESMSRWHKKATDAEVSSGKVLGLMMLKDISDPNRHPLDAMEDLAAVVNDKDGNAEV